MVRPVRADDYGGERRDRGWFALVPPPAPTVAPAAEEILTNQRAILRRKKSSTSARFRKEKNTGCARSLSVLPLPAEHDPSGKPGHKINVEDRPCRKLLRKSLRMAPYNQDECNYHSLTSQVSYHEFFMFAFSEHRCTPI